MVLPDQNKTSFMDAREVLRKLRFTSGDPFSLVNAPCYLQERLAEAAGEVHFELQDQSPFTVLVVRDREDFEKWFEGTINRAKPDSLFWLVYPKGTGQFASDINRDSLWKAMEPLGYRPVSMIAVDEDWSAMRVRPLV